jgi:ABC-2 type transport system ATP-binding protein
VNHLVEFSSRNGGAAADLAALQAIDGVRHATEELGTVRIEAIELHRVLPALLEELRRQGVPLTELRTHSATLEDVFVSLTGRHLRDE